MLDQEIEVPEGVVPGVTPGWPVDPITGAVLDLPDVDRQRLAALGGQPTPLSAMSESGNPLVPPDTMRKVRKPLRP